MYASFKKRGNIYQVNIRIKERIDGKPVDIINERVLSIEAEDLLWMTLEEFRDYLNESVEDINLRLESINRKTVVKYGDKEKYHISSMECRFEILKKYNEMLKGFEMSERSVGVPF